MPLSRRAILLLVFVSPALAANALSANHAVIVGVSDYPSDPGLLYAANDADDVQAALQADAVRWPNGSIVSFTDGAALTDDIHEAVIAMQTGVAGDVCVLYLSGRGRQVASLIEADGYDEAIDLHDESLTDDTLATWLAGFTNESVLLIVEASYAGGMLDASADANTVAILSCGELETAENDDASLKNATFTYNLVRALRHYAVDADASGSYSAQEAFDAVPVLASQTPILDDGIGSDLDLRCLWQGHAVFVGISDYPGSGSDLSYCDQDALDVSEVLMQDARHWDPSRRVVLLNSEAQFDAIKAAIRDRRNDADVFLFFYSGHGTRDPYTLVPASDPDPRPGDEPTDEALVAYDFDILDDHLEAWFADFRSDEICLMIDSCFAGGIAKSTGVESAQTWASDFAEDLARGPRGALKGLKDLDDGNQNGLVAVMACDDDQSSMEDDALSNGVFTFFVIEAMCTLSADTDADGYLSAEETYDFAGPRAQQFWGGQVAQIFPDNTGAFDLLTAADRQRPASSNREDSLPFGGSDGIRGCAAGTSSGRKGGAMVLATVLAAACIVRKRQAMLVAATALFIVAGCGEYDYYNGYGGGPQGAYSQPYPPPPPPPANAQGPMAAPLQPASSLQARYYVWTPRGFMEARPDPRMHPAPEYYVWTSNGFAIANPQPAPEPEPALPPAAAQEGDPRAPQQPYPQQGAAQQFPQPGMNVRAPYAGAQIGQPSMTPWPEEEDEGPSRRPRFCPQLGVFMPVGAQTQDYAGGPGPGFGLSGRLFFFNYDVGAALFVVQGVDVDVTAYVTYLHADLVFPFARGESVEFFASGGPRIIVASSETSWGTSEEITGAVGIAGGIRRPLKGWEVKFTFDSLLDSTNIQGLIGGHFAWRF
jgi:uncharacterized caspase-like protein